MDNQIFKNVVLGIDVKIHPPCIIGFPPRGKGDGELSAVIGDRAIIRPFSTICAGTTIGHDFKSGQGMCIREDNIIGDDVSIGTHSVLEFGNRIGNGVRIHSSCFLEDVKVGNYVFIGPNVVFTDDPHPMNCPHYLECADGATVEDYAKIGANCTILPGLRIGENCLIGAGTVLVTDVPPDAVVVGNPGREVNKVDKLTCPPGFFERPYVWEPYPKVKKGTSQDK